jgi:hypothetical protein
VGEGGDMTPEAFGLLRAQELEAKIKQLGPSTTWRPSSASRCRVRVA